MRLRGLVQVLVTHNHPLPCRRNTCMYALCACSLALNVNDATLCLGLDAIHLMIQSLVQSLVYRITPRKKKKKTKVYMQEMLHQRHNQHLIYLIGRGPPAGWMDASCFPFLLLCSASSSLAFGECRHAQSCQGGFGSKILLLSGVWSVVQPRCYILEI